MGPRAGAGIASPCFFCTADGLRLAHRAPARELCHRGVWARCQSLRESHRRRVPNAPTCAAPHASAPRPLVISRLPRKPPEPLTASRIAGSRNARESGANESAIGTEMRGVSGDCRQAGEIGADLSSLREDDEGKSPTSGQLDIGRVMPAIARGGIARPCRPACLRPQPASRRQAFAEIANCRKTHVQPELDAGLAVPHWRWLAAWDAQRRIGRSGSRNREVKK
jgi:hypothetical protein